MLTNADNPRPKRRAAARITRPRAPLWDARATRPGPGGGRIGDKEALSRTAGSVLSSPRQFGPISRIP